VKLKLLACGKCALQINLGSRTALIQHESKSATWLAWVVKLKKMTKKRHCTITKAVHMTRALCSKSFEGIQQEKYWNLTHYLLKILNLIHICQYCYHSRFYVSDDKKFSVKNNWILGKASEDLEYSTWGLMDHIYDSLLSFSYSLTAPDHFHCVEKSSVNILYISACSLQKKENWVWNDMKVCK